MTELWGHRCKAGAGNGKAGASDGEAGKQICQRNRNRDADRKRVGKPAERLSGKAAIVHSTPVPETDTGG